MGQSNKINSIPFWISWLKELLQKYYKAKIVSTDKKKAKKSPKSR